MYRPFAELTFIIFEKADGEREADCMIGDINLFLQDEDHVEDYLEMAGDTAPRSSAAYPAFPTRTAELMVMIAEPTARRKGYAKEAIGLMMKYGKCLVKLLHRVDR